MTPRSPGPAWTAGAYLSFAGPVTFKPNAALREALAVTPLDRVLVETDAPYLTPMPFRGRPNASYLIPHTARFLADHLGVDLADAVPGTDRQRGRSLRRGVVVELAEVLRRRRMVRAYAADRPVPAGAARPGLRRRAAGSVGRLHPGRLAAGPDQRRAARGLLGRRPLGQPRVRWLAGMRTAPVLVLLWTSRAAYLDRYAEPDKGWTDRDPERWSAPYWFVDGGMAALAMLLTATDAGLGACFFGIPTRGSAPCGRRSASRRSSLSVGVVSLGYAAAGGRQARRHDGRDGDPTS